MTRRATKIVVTLGPASSDPALLEQMIRAGVNVVRLNFSHGKAQDHIDRARLAQNDPERQLVLVEPLARRVAQCRRHVPSPSNRSRSPILSGPARRVTRR